MAYPQTTPAPAESNKNKIVVSVVIFALLALGGWYLSTLGTHAPSSDGETSSTSPTSTTGTPVSATHTTSAPQSPAASAPKPSASSPVPSTKMTPGVSGPTALPIDTEGTWTFSIPLGTKYPVAYTVCWGDGTCGVGETKTFYQNVGDTVTESHTYSQTGPYIVTAGVGQTQYTFTLSVLSAPGVFVISYDKDLAFSVGVFKRVTFTLPPGDDIAYWEFNSHPAPNLKFRAPSASEINCSATTVCPDTSSRTLYLEGTGTTHDIGTYTTVLSAKDSSGHTTRRTLTISIKP